MSHRCCLLLLVAVPLAFSAGCALVPHRLTEPRYHNPWPQLEKVAVAPFYNLSNMPTVNQDLVAESYANELQQIPGFEVIPVGVTKRAMAMYRVAGESAEDYQRLARLMGVDAIVVGTVNDFSPYYPPRLAMSVRWYAANPCFHPMPAGYGLPWGEEEEQHLPPDVVEAAEFELAKAQLATQTPMPPEGLLQQDLSPLASGFTSARNASQSSEAVEPLAPGEVAQAPADAIAVEPARLPAGAIAAGGLPPNWPDPSGFIPPPPQAVCTDCEPYFGPILSLTRSYNGHDSDLTEALASYYEYRDEARFGGWQAYLQRSEDFIRFCCYMHITEMLAARGGARESKVVYRWPISRYDR